MLPQHAGWNKHLEPWHPELTSHVEKITARSGAGSDCQHRLFSFKDEIFLKSIFTTSMTSVDHVKGIPMPIVSLNRVMLLTGITTAVILQQPLITTALFLIILPTVLWGQKASLVYFIGSRLFEKQNRTATSESPKLMRFNNSIAVTLLGLAQIAFFLEATLAGWIISGIVALAALVALCGFCFGCFLFYQFNLQRYRLFGR
jgi:hypothetical protein